MPNFSEYNNTSRPKEKGSAIKNIKAAYNKLWVKENFLGKLLTIGLLLSILSFLAFIIYAITKPNPDMVRWKQLTTIGESVCIDERGDNEAPLYLENGKNTFIIFPIKYIPPLQSKWEVMKETNLYLPTDLLPAEDKLPSLIACVDPENKQVQVCDYIATSGQVKRYRVDTTLTLRSATDGEIVYEEIILGGNPPKCPSSTSDFSDQYGSSMSDEEVAEWIADWINMGGH